MHRSTFFFTSAIIQGEWSASRPGRFNPGERTPGIIWIGGWMGSTTGLDDVEMRKIVHRDSNSGPSAVQPLPSHHTNCCIRAQKYLVKSENYEAPLCEILFNFLLPGHRYFQIYLSAPCS
jgi:hypothetical protein